MSQRDPMAAMRHMLEYARKAVRICESKTRGDLQDDELLQLGLTRAVELIGEAANRVPSELRDRYHDIPWAQIIGTRHRLIHGYDRIDLNILWDTIREDLPPLIAQLHRALHE